MTARVAMASPPPSSSAHVVDPGDARFEAFLAASIAPGAPPEVTRELHAGLRRQRAKPPVRETEAVVRETATEDRVRQMLYWPDARDAALYPALIAGPPPGAPADHPARKTQVAYLGLLYLAHANDWRFVQPFIVAGGLRSLVGMFDHADLRIRGQAVDVFHRATSEDAFPWHEAPRPNTSDEAAHRAMLELASGPVARKLLDNRERSYPGGAFQCLRVFAFYVSWLRRRHSRGNVLRLGPEVLAILDEWSRRDAPDASEEERSLAGRLRDDFARFEGASDGDDATDVAGSVEGRATAGSVEGRVGSVEDGSGRGKKESDPTTIDAPEENASAEDASVDAGEAYKRKGNDAFRRRRFDDAVDAYSAALDAPVSYQRLVTEQPRRATYHCNRAAAYLARGATPSGGSEARDTRGLLGDADLGDERLLAGVEGPSGPSSSVSSSVASVASTLHAKAALMDCDSALELAPSHVKANFRRAQALWRLGRREEALEAATKSFRAAETEAEEREARALAEAIEAGPWRRPGEKVEGEENEDEETTGMNPHPDGDEPPGQRGRGDGDGDGRGDGSGGVARRGRSPEEDARRSFVSAAASALGRRASEARRARGCGGIGRARGGAERGRGRARDGRGRRVRSRLMKDALTNGFRREGELSRVDERNGRTPPVMSRTTTHSAARARRHDLVIVQPTSPRNKPAASP